MQPDGILTPELRPRLRGVSHQWAFLVAVAAGVALVAAADGARATISIGIYAASVAALFAASATYHRVTWRTAAARQRAKRVDHCSIFVVIAGSYTPFALLVLDGTLATAILVTVWAGAAAGIVLKLVWIDAPRWLVATTYVALGWVAVAAFPALLTELGAAAVALVAAGGLLYTAGAVVYARQRPDPVPAVFGYHEVFHALVIGAAALHYAVIAGWVV